ncbi:PREDICTED: rho guanine nucleotide exchange factor 11-like [Tinamus guttatus]|uniref:rho guanine nucleotide exchange factor 11-like n=1 Tax=Tinamus guttatus TaxID=94827 RepID=UPI00052EBD17|nr:PREDICTED: rho guanine nucleotide exchange factor 11-like [Tinamus guttatus]
MPGLAPEGLGEQWEPGWRTGKLQGIRAAPTEAVGIAPRVAGPPRMVVAGRDREANGSPSCPASCPIPVRSRLSLRRHSGTHSGRGIPAELYPSGAVSLRSSPSAALRPRRLGSLSSGSDASSEHKSPGHRRQPSDAAETTGLVQRCVIIQKDQHGFGFTVSGDRVVLVQSVRPGGAAMRAGVQEGDRIVKVNGTMVTNSSHLEVVKLIKCLRWEMFGRGAAALSLGNGGTEFRAAARLGSPVCSQRYRELYNRNPGTGVEGPRERRLSQLQLKILQETGGSVDLGRLAGDTGLANSRAAEGRLSLDSQDGDSGLESGTERFPSVSENPPGFAEGSLEPLGRSRERPGRPVTAAPCPEQVSLNRNSVLSDHGVDSPRTSPVVAARACQRHRRQGSDTAFAAEQVGAEGTGASERPRRGARRVLPVPCPPQGLERAARPLIIGPEEDYEPGCFNNECDSLFQDLGKLKSRPAHLGVFLRYIFSQADPSPLLFYLCADVCQQTPTKDSRGLAKDIWNIFLDRNAPLRVKVSEQLLAEIETRLRYGDDVRVALFEAQEMVMPEIQEQIQDYRTKRTMGLGSLYGENDLLELDGDPQKERQVAEKQLAQLGDILSKYEEDRSSPMAFALSTYMNHTGIRSREPRGAGAGEKAQALPDKDKWLPFFPKTKKSSSTKKDKDAMEDKKRNPILKYIGKPKISSQSTFHVPLSPVEGKRPLLLFAIHLIRSVLFSPLPRGPQSLENPTPPYTPKMGRRSIESPSLGFGLDPFLPHLLEDEQGPLSDLEPELDAQNWQHTVSRELVANLPQKEIDRQEVINELFATEGSHLRILRVLDLLFYQRMKKESLLSREELALLFPNLPDVIEIHNSLSESMKKLREEGPIIKEIGDLMLSRFDGAAKEEIQQVAADFCSYQSIALELIKTKQRKESRFQLFMQEAESNPQCRRLQLKDLIISEMQRLTKYPLLLENILKHTEAGTSEHDKLCRARDQCRDILKYVNEAVKRAENRHRLEGYQKRLDATSLERTNNPLAAEFKSLDLTSRRMIHEGPLTWRVSKDKTVDLHVLLLEDLLVLLQKQDEKLVLKCHSKTALGSSDNKQSFSPVLKLNAVLIRSVATDKRALFIICTSELGPQIYELVALTSSEKNT